MINPLDKLFKDKLAGHALAPPAHAWTRVEAGLSKKNNGMFRYRIAAAVLLLGALAATLVWLASRNAPSNSDPLTQNAAAKPGQKLLETQPSSDEKNRKDQTMRKNKKKEGLHLETQKSPGLPVERKEAFAQTESPDPAEGIETIAQPAAVTESVTAIATQTKIEKPVVIEYRLETIESTPASPSPAAAKEKSGFRKVLDFALVAKNSSPLGDLRDAKDELFAFNFIKEKQKTAK